MGPVARLSAFAVCVPNSRLGSLSLEKALARACCESAGFLHLCRKLCRSLEHWNIGNIGVRSQHSTRRIDLAEAAWWWTTAPWSDHCVLRLGYESTATALGALD